MTKDTLEVVGVIAGAFDVLHPGYIKMFKDAKENACDKLIILLHEDPSVERPETKLKPILNVSERVELLLSLRYIDEVIPYKTEAELYELLKGLNPNVRIIGTDYHGKKFTGDDLEIPLYYHKRDHEWSATAYKKAVCQSLAKEGIV